MIPMPIRLLDLDDPKARASLEKLFSKPLMRVEFNCGAGGYINEDVADGFIREHSERCGCETGGAVT